MSLREKSRVRQNCTVLGIVGSDGFITRFNENLVYRYMLWLLQSIDHRSCYVFGAQNARPTRLPVELQRFLITTESLQAGSNVARLEGCHLESRTGRL